MTTYRLLALTTGAFVAGAGIGAVVLAAVSYWYTEGWDR